MKEKLKQLWADDRPFKSRMPIALLIGGAYAFTFVLFNCIDLYARNRGDFPFYFNELLPSTILFSLLCFAIIAAFFLLIRGKLFDIFVCLALGILLACYIQGAFLNLDLGDLAGQAILWEQYTRPSLLNLLVWGVLIAIPFIVYYFSKDAWKKVAILLPVVLIGMQFAGLASTLAATPDLDTKREEVKYLSREGIYDLSKNENVVVLLVDHLDGTYLAAAMEENPALFENLDGFTYFPDYMSTYSHTLPSVTYMFTGQDYGYEYYYVDYYLDAWKNNTFFQDIRAQDYKIQYYEIEYCCRAETVEGLVENVSSNSEAVFDVDSKEIQKKMLKLAGYRYAPQVAKAPFWTPNSFFADTVAYQDNAIYTTDDELFYQGLKEQRLSADNPSNLFTYYHLMGTHPPLVMTADAQVNPDGTSESEATQGMFTILTDYFQQMKDLGIYEDSTIIIISDHGRPGYLREEYNGSVTCGFFIKPSGSAGTPLATSEAEVCDKNFRPTVIDAIGGDTAKYGQTVFDVPEGKEIVRYHIPNDYYEYEVHGDARNRDNWIQGAKTEPYPNGPK